MRDARAQLGQLDEVAHRLAHAVGNVADVGDLRAHVEMQQLQAMAHAGIAQVLPQVQQLARIQPELGLVAAAVLPLAGAQRGQAHAYAQAGHHVQRLGFLQHQLQLGGLLDDDEGLQAQLAADQRQADELAVLVAVADDDAARLGQSNHGHQLGLTASLQTEAARCMLGQSGRYTVMLIDLDGIDGAVFAGVIPIGDGLGKRILQFREAVIQDVREAQQQRQTTALGYGAIDQFGQGRTGPLLTLRTHDDLTGRVDIKIAITPVRDGVCGAGLVNGPAGHGVAGSRAQGNSSILAPSKRTPVNTRCGNREQV